MPPRVPRSPKKRCRLAEMSDMTLREHHHAVMHFEPGLRTLLWEFGVQAEMDVVDPSLAPNKELRRPIPLREVP